MSRSARSAPHRAAIAAALALGLATATPASADPVWERYPTIGFNVGLSLVANLGPLHERKRFGVGLDGAWQGMWYEGKVGYDGPSPISPTGRLSVHFGWTHPVVYSSFVAQAGAMVPLEVYRRGFVPAGGLLAGVGVGAATDGSVGPLLTSTAIATVVESRFEVGNWRGSWHGARLSTGLQVPVNCCIGASPPPIEFTVTRSEPPPSPGGPEPTAGVR